MLSYKDAHVHGMGRSPTHFSFIRTTQRIGKVNKVKRKLNLRCTRIFMTNKERHENRYQRRKLKRLQKRREINSQYDDYSILLNPQILLESFMICRKGVSWKYSVQYYHLHLLENISNAIKLLNNNTLPSKGFTCFSINERGKTRDIKSPHISERVVQKVLCNWILLPILKRTLIYDNGASLQGKGTDFAKRRLIHHLSSYRRQYGTEGYALLIDFSKYFENISHEHLLKMLKNYITDKRVLNICEQALKEFGDKGLGLGAQISQILAIFFPSLIDHFFKEHRQEKYYGRYMDDSYILSPSKDHLLQSLIVLENLCKSLDIKINTRKTRITKLKYGVTFLHCRYNFCNTGKIYKRGGRESAKRTRHKIHYFYKELKNGTITFEEVYNWYKSWRGYMLTFDSKVVLKNTDILFDNLIGGKYDISFYKKQES